MELLKCYLMLFKEIVEGGSANFKEIGRSADIVAGK